MKSVMAAGLTLGLGLAAPVQALEHRESIHHEAGAIAAEYSGSTRIAYRQVGSPGLAGRPGSLGCKWSVTLSVQRSAVMASRLRADRTLVHENVLQGVRPGWCQDVRGPIERLVEARRFELHEAMVVLAAQDRADILAEAARSLAKADG